MNNKKQRRWNKKMIVDTIRTLYRKNLPLNPALNPKLFTAAVRHFGSYEKAIKKAGLSYEELGIRSIKKWNREKIIRTIQEFHRKGRYLNGQYIKQKYPFLYAAACYYFPYAWEKAVKAAGIDYGKDIRKSFGWDKTRIVRTIETLHKNKKSLQPYLNSKLFNAAKRCFGSYQAAIQAAGLSYKKLGIRVSGEWHNKEKIKEELQKRFRKGKPLDASYMANHHSTSGLYKAARSQFGSYKNALKTAGIDYRYVWRAGDLQEWLEDLTSNDMKNIEKRILSLTKKGG